MTPHLFPWANKSNTIGNGMLDYDSKFKSSVTTQHVIFHFFPLGIMLVLKFCVQFLLGPYLDRIKFIFKNCLPVQAFDHSSYNKFSV